jgi:hypothetical protein
MEAAYGHRRLIEDAMREVRMLTATGSILVGKCYLSHSNSV